MVQLDPREIEVIAHLIALGGRATYNSLYNAIKESLISRDLKISGRATFNKILKGLCEKRILAKRGRIYLLTKFARRMTLPENLIKRRLPRLEKLFSDLAKKELKPQHLPLIFWGRRLSYEGIINYILLKACRGEKPEKVIQELFGGPSR